MQTKTSVLVPISISAALFCAPLWAQGLITHPTVKKPVARVKSVTRPKPAPPRVELFENVSYAGEKLIVNDNLPALPPPLGHTESGKQGQVSSLKVNHKGWVVFWEGKNYDEDDDQLWVEGPAVISDLAKLHRPHGNNHWNDRILAVSFASAPPAGNNKNRTIIPRQTNVR